MRILMLMPRFPYPPDRGDTVRSWAVLEGLARRHEIWLACVDQQAPAAGNLQRVRDICREVAVFVRSPFVSVVRGGRSWLAGRSFTAGYFEDRRFAMLVSEWSRAVRFDALWTYSSSIAPVAEGVTAARSVLDLCDVDSTKWSVYAARTAASVRGLLRSEARRVALLEQSAARRHDLTLVVNERERSKLARLTPGCSTATLPTTIASSDYAELVALPSAPVIGMVGSMFYPPNVRAVNWFGRHVWPRIRVAIPAARWRIVGAAPRRSVRRWARQPGISVTGHVEDVRPYLAGLRVFVNAVDGDIGLQSKVVVAMAAGRPTVVTPECAAGIAYDDPPPFLIAASPEQFAEAVVRLLRDDALARALAVRARATVRAGYETTEWIGRIERWLGAARCGAPSSRLVAGVRGAGDERLVLVGADEAGGW